MRYFTCVLAFVISLLSVAFPAQADTWRDYMVVQCDPAKGIFKLWDTRIYNGAPNGEQAGELIAKTKGVTYVAAETEEMVDYLIAKKDISSELASCKIKVVDDVVTFSVRRTSIDGGNVQGQCGAANSAEVTLFSDDKPIAVYPSAKEDCFSFNHIGNHPRVTVAPFEGIEICENRKLLNYGSGNFKLKQKGHICRTGYIDAHVARQKKTEAKDEDEDLYPLSKITSRQYIRELNWKNRETWNNLQTAEQTIKDKNQEISELADQLREMQESIDNLQAELNTPPKRSFSNKFRDLFSRD